MTAATAPITAAATAAASMASTARDSSSACRITTRWATGARRATGDAAGAGGPAAGLRAAPGFARACRWCSWAKSTARRAPFPFFCSFEDPALVEVVRRGRREEFAGVKVRLGDGDSRPAKPGHLRRGQAPLGLARRLAAVATPPALSRPAGGAARLAGPPRPAAHDRPRDRRRAGPPRRQPRVDPRDRAWPGRRLLRRGEPCRPRGRAPVAGARRRATLAEHRRRPLRRQPRGGSIAAAAWAV